MKQSQNKKVAEYLAKGRSLTSLKALELFGIMRLASRVNDLRNEGIPICSKLVSRNGKKYSVYFLEKKE